MISPTGLGIRNDSEGSGAYGSKRGRRIHKGTDYLAEPNQDIVAPFNMFIKRYAAPTSAFPLTSGIAWSTPYMIGKMFYFVPDPHLITAVVTKGQYIGTAIDLKKYYSKEMSSHIHFQIDSIDPEFLRSLSEVITNFHL